MPACDLNTWRVKYGIRRETVNTLPSSQLVQQLLEGGSNQTVGHCQKKQALNSEAVIQSIIPEIKAKGGTVGITLCITCMNLCVCMIQ
jgi:hypothetical protein